MPRLDKHQASVAWSLDLSPRKTFTAIGSNPIPDIRGSDSTAGVEATTAESFCRHASVSRIPPEPAVILINGRNVLKLNERHRRLGGRSVAVP